MVDSATDVAEMWRRVCELAESQYGYVSNADLAGIGYTRGQIRSLCTTGRLDRQRPGLFQLPGVRPTGRSRLYLHTITTGGYASHLSAAVLLGLGRPDNLWPGRFEVTVAPGTKPRGQPQLRLYRMRGAETMSTIVSGIRCTNVDRTLLDLAADHPFEVFRNCLSEGMRRRLTNAERLSGAARGADALRRKNRRTMAEALRSVLYTTVPMSDWSNWAVDRLLANQIPRPELEATIHDTNGRVIGQVDLYWPEFRLVVELDGRQFHWSHESFANDRKRDARLSAEGILVLRFTWEQYLDHDYFLGTIARVLADRGLAAYFGTLRLHDMLFRTEWFRDDPRVPASGSNSAGRTDIATRVWESGVWSAFSPVRERPPWPAKTKVGGVPRLPPPNPQKKSDSPRGTRRPGSRKTDPCSRPPVHHLVSAIRPTNSADTRSDSVCSATKIRPESRPVDLTSSTITPLRDTSRNHGDDAPRAHSAAAGGPCFASGL